MEALWTYAENITWFILDTVIEWDWFTWVQVLSGLWLLADIITTLEIALRRRIFEAYGLPGPKWFFYLPVLYRNLLRWPWSLHKYGTNIFIWSHYDWKNGRPDDLWGI